MSWFFRNRYFFFFLFSVPRTFAHRSGPMMRTVAILKHAGPVSRLLRRDVEERGERVHRSVGAHLWLIGQANKFVATYFVDYVRGPLVPELQREGTFVLSWTSGPLESFLLNGWPNTSYALLAVRAGVLCTRVLFSPVASTLFIRDMWQPVTGRFFLLHLIAIQCHSSWVTRALALKH